MRGAGRWLGATYGAGRWLGAGGATRGEVTCSVGMWPGFACGAGWWPRGVRWWLGANCGAW
eukprot:2151441-Prymnesium_polylepis.2